MKFKLVQKDDRFIECKLIDYDNTQINLLNHTISLKIDADYGGARLTLNIRPEDIEINGDEVYLSVGDDEYEVVAVKVK